MKDNPYLCTRILGKSYAFDLVTRCDDGGWRGKDVMMRQQLIIQFQCI